MNDIKAFINQLPKSSPRKRTYLEIMKASTRETIMANLFAYYFRPDEDHGLGDIFIRGLLNTTCYELLSPDSCRQPHDVLKLKEEKILWAKVETEDVTDDDKRIDLVIETDKLLIAIEFKINHSLNNPLNTYASHISHRNPLKKPVYFVVLTPVWKLPEKECQINTDFRQVMINHFLERIDLLIKENTSQNTRTDLQYQYFQDFLTTFKNRKITFEMIKEYQDEAKNDNDFQKKLDQVYSDLQKIKLELESKMSEVNKGLNNYSLISSSKNKLQTVIQKKFGPVNVIKLRLSISGWNLEKWQYNEKKMTCAIDFNTSPEKLISDITALEKEYKNLK